MKTGSYLAVPPALAKPPAQPCAPTWSPPADRTPHHHVRRSPQQAWGQGLPGVRGFLGGRSFGTSQVDQGERSSSGSAFFILHSIAITGPSTGRTPVNVSLADVSASRRPLPTSGRSLWLSLLFHQALACFPHLLATCPCSRPLWNLACVPTTHT